MAPSCRCAPLRVFYGRFTTACNADMYSDSLRLHVDVIRLFHLGPIW